MSHQNHVKLYYDNGETIQTVYASFKDGENGQLNYKFLRMTEEQISELPSEDLKFAHKWVYYHHDNDDDDWSEESFVKVFEISNLYELWKVFTFLETVQRGIHFLVREGTSPCWDNPINSHLWWIKRKNQTDNEACCAWADLAISVIGLRIFKDFESHKDVINGISISYKDNDAVFKIMLNKKIDDPKMYNSISLGTDYIFDFIKGGRLIENTGGKKENILKNKNYSPKKNYRKPLRAVN